MMRTIKIRQLRYATLTVLLFFSFCAMQAKAQTTVTGTITGEDNLPLPSVTVSVKGSTDGTTSDNNGKYSISAGPNSVLVFSFIGMVRKEVPVDGRTTVDVVLIESIKSLDDVVVVGYGTQQKSHLTGSISKVANDKLDQMAVSRVDDALIGQVSGVNIQATNAEPGAAPTITIRGFGSINANSGPAVVVDGIVVDPEFLGNMDMNDVASFEVLKDAASAAIYGSEGSNGVILVTTKSGEAGETKFSYETYFARKSAFGSDGYRKSVADWAALELSEVGELSNETQYAQLLVETTGVDRDWQDVFFDGGNVVSHSLSARGGNQQTKFSTSLRYLHDEGVVITDDYKLYTLNLKLDSKLTERLRFGLKATPSYSKRRALPTSIHNPIRQSPWLPIYHTEETLQFINRTAYPNVGVGDYFLENHLIQLDVDGVGGTGRPRTSGDMNPFAQYVEREHFEFKTNLLSSAYLSYKIADGLTVKTSLGVTLEQRKRTRYNGTLHHAAGASRASYNLQNRYRTRLISDNTINYQKEFGNHEVAALLGATFQKRSSENSTVSGNGFTNDLLKNLQGATMISDYEELNFERKKIGYFARVNYAYADKYLVSASFRRDGSSVFGVDSKWGNFPAISVGWNAHNEDFFMSNLVSSLKLRVSYGLTGNENFNVGDDIINAYPYLALLNTANAVTDDAISPGVAARNIANTLLQWEASREFNPGIDFGLWDDRITGSLDYYVRTSDKLLLENPVSYVTGFSGGIVNLGKVQNRGVELEVRSRNLTEGKLKWSSTIIASTNKNELLSFGESDGALLEDTYGRNSQWINSVGNPISSFYGFVVDRELPDTYINTPYHPINSSAEDIIVKDLNGDGIITDEDKTILGDPYPDLIWSFTNEFQYGDFDFSIMIQGSQGAEVKNIGDQYFFNWFGQATVNPQQAVDDGEVPHISFIQEKVLTNEVVQPAGYFSVRNINIGYNFPKEQAARLGLENLRVYVSGQNLFYKTSDRYFGFNPEFIDGNNPRAYGAQRAGTPLFRTMSVGLNIKF
ncbi:SusC/RagA family TonB-linked outer membrane protein [Roseivirga sp.]|uniref:SusC/RagA family TonB-linked outer membrane protein n=1 Tax=Roseivirga sp. TaxID=1964215 RepID=UPI003B8E8FE1